jgi:hypothetical protein
MSPELVCLGHADGLRTSLLIEVDQKWPADAQSGASGDERVMVKLRRLAAIRKARI